MLAPDTSDTKIRVHAEFWKFCTDAPKPVYNSTWKEPRPLRVRVSPPHVKALTFTTLPRISASASSLSLNRTSTHFSPDLVLQLRLDSGAGLGNDWLSCIWRCSGRPVEQDAKKYPPTCISSTTDSLSLPRAGPFCSSMLLRRWSSYCLLWLIQEYIKAVLRQTERLIFPRQWEDRSNHKKHY